MIRNFTLTNALGASFSLMNAQEGAFFEPQGLGFNDATQYEQVGEFFAPLTQRYGQQVITGSMVFGSQPYEHYLTFTKFCQHAPLSLVYETDAGTFQIPCRLTKIEKGDTDGWTYLNCKVEFTALARLYKTVVANNTGTAGGGKVYLAKDLPDITGSIITIDNAEAGEVLNITADINPIQDLHGYDAPWVGGAGKNKWNPQGYTGVGYNIADGTTVALTEASATVTGNTISYTISSWGNRDFKTNKLQAGNYHIHLDATSISNPRISIYLVGSDNVIKSHTNHADSVTIDATRTVDNDDYILLSIGSNTAQDITIPNYQIESGSAFTEWTPYENICPISGHTEVDVVVSPTTDAEDGTTYTTALGRTVYGGTLDLVSGLLTVDRAMVDMGSLNWYVNVAITGGVQYAVTISDKKVGETNFICSAYETHTPSAVLGYICGRASTSVVACNATQTNVDDFKTAVTGQTIVYELATPQTYQLTPQQIQTLLGQNNVWANSGDITITGRKTYGYKYNYTYGNFVADTVTIDSDSATSSPCRITIFGECTQPTWRHYLDGNSVATGYYNGTIPSGHKLVIDTTSSPYSIEEQDIAGNLIADRYELCDFSTERFFLLEYGHNTISVSHTDPDSIRLMVEGYIFYETV